MLNWPFRRGGAGVAFLLAAAFLLVASLGATSQRPGGSELYLPLVFHDSARTERIYLPVVGVAVQPGRVIQLQHGINFINSAEDPVGAQEYALGRLAGASWNRWPLYWFNEEISPQQFDWTAADQTILSDVNEQFKSNVILLGTPPFYTTSSAPIEREATVVRPGPLSLFAPEAATPVGLYDPIFTDGTDRPGVGKAINPQNHWAWFVYTAVNRYKPGGVLAQAHGWTAGQGATHWEMWNEPDLDIFWDSSLPDYARLLKVGYLAAKQADPQAVILFGGLANNFEKLNYYRDVLAIYAQDSMAASHNHYHDILATHSYFYAWQSWYHVYRAKNGMRDYGFDKPIWLNEHGVPAWNDYPGPVWDSGSGLRATMTEQADYLIQSAFYAASAGVEAIFHFQLFDGCGNQPRGTDFPPHHGELCDENGRLISNPAFPCAGDANGLFRNPTTAACFTQHPQPQTARPNLAAQQIVTTHLQDTQFLWRLRPGGTNPYDGPQEWIAFYRPSTRERILGMWARFGQAETAVVPAVAPSGKLLTPDGQVQVITPVNGYYTLTLPAATNQNAFWDPTLYPIGGRPYILIEVVE